MGLISDSLMVSDDLRAACELVWLPGVHEFPENGGHSLTLHPHIPVHSTTLLYSEEFQCTLDGWMDG